MKLSYKSLLLFCMFFGLHTIKSMNKPINLQNSLKQFKNSLDTLKTELLLFSKQEPTKPKYPEYFDQYFNELKGHSEQQLKHYIEKLIEIFEKASATKTLDTTTAQKLITLEEDYNENLEFLRDAFSPYTPKEQNALWVILEYLNNIIHNLKKSFSTLFNTEDKKKYTDLINKSLTSAKQFQTQFNKPKTQSQFISNRNLFIDRKYLVNRINYNKFISSNLLIPIISKKTDHKIQQVLTLNQFLTPVDLLDPHSEHSQAISEATGLNMVEYNNLILENPTNKLLQRSLKPNESILIGGGAASCGYQALRNCLILLKMFGSKNQDEYLNHLNSLYDIKLANLIFGDAQINTLVGNPNAPGTWRQQIIKWRTEGYDPHYEKEEGEAPDLTGDWLSIGETIELIKKIEPQYTKNITVYASPKPLDPTQENEIYTTLKTPNKFHCFIIKAGEGNRVHWFTLVVTTNSKGQKTYTIADSTNIPRYPQEFNKDAPQDFYSPLLDEIINLLES